MSVEEFKEVHKEFSEKITENYQKEIFAGDLIQINDNLQLIEEILADGGMEGISYTDQTDEISKIEEGITQLDAYIATMQSEALEKLNDPLYKSFNEIATEMLSRIDSNNYKTDNNLGIKTRKVMYDKNGKQMEYIEEKKTLNFEDFLGVNSLKEGKQEYSVYVPKEFEDFTEMFRLDYENLKKDGKMEGVELEDYLTYLSKMENFDHKMDKPFLQFLSSVLDITLIKPLIEMCTGYDLLTKEDLSDLERGMKGVYLVVDIVTMFMGFKGSAILKMGAKQALKQVGKTLTLDLLASGVSYGASKVCEEMNLPLPLTLILSGAAGIGVVLVGAKYIFKNSAGDIICEIGQETVENGIKKASKGAGGADDIIKKVKNGDIKLESTKHKGNFGEMVQDDFYEGANKNLNRISKDKVSSLDDKIHQGIDGIYEDPTGGPPKFVISEAKYGTSKLNTLKDGTQQMSDKWVRDRLVEAVGQTKAQEIFDEMLLNPQNVQTTLLQIDKNGDVLETILKNGKKLK